MAKDTCTRGHDPPRQNQQRQFITRYRQPKQAFHRNGQLQAFGYQRRSHIPDMTIPAPALDCQDCKHGDGKRWRNRDQKKNVVDAETSGDSKSREGSESNHYQRDREEDSGEDEESIPSDFGRLFVVWFRP